MSKILKRPMFREGGKVNSQGTGIMSGFEPRMNYAQAGQVLPYSETVEKQKRIQDILKTDFKTAEDFGKEYDTYVESLDPTMLFGVDEFGPGSYGESLVEKYRVASSPEVKQSFISEKLAEQQKVIDEAKALGISDEKIPESLRTEPDVREGKILEGPAPKVEAEGRLQEPTQSDLKAVYEDLLPLFEKELGPEEDEFRRQKYMQLAKFGLGLLAQPGGSLAEAVGKAGAEPLAGLEAAAAREAQARRAPRALALEAAMKEVDPSDVVKKVKALSKLSGLPQETVARSFVTTGEETRAEAKVDDYLRESATNLGLSGGAGLNYTKQVKAVYDVDPSLAGKFDKLVPEKPTENEYYVTTSGDLVRYKDGQFLIPGDKGFRD